MSGRLDARAWHSRGRGVVAVVVGLSLALVGLLFPASSAGADARTGRLLGQDRFRTAAAISRYLFPEHADAVFLARADDFPDALAAGALSGGPILLVPAGVEQVPVVVTEEIARLAPRQVIALGGPSAVTDAALEHAAGRGRDARRLAGAGRFETAVEISKFGFPDGAATVYLARADSFPDALAAGGLSGGSILLVPSAGEVPEVVLDEVRRLDPDQVVALGGSAAVADGVLDQVADGRDQQRLAGPDRFGTAAAIARFGFPDGSRTALLARADSFPDALAAGAVTGAPILLAPPCGSPPETLLDALTELEATTVIALGGEQAVCESTLQAAAAAGATWLIDLEHPDREPYWAETGDYSVEGSVYPASFALDPGNCGPGCGVFRYTWRLNGEYTHFRAMLGMGADSEAGPGRDAKIQLVADGRRFAEVPVAIGSGVVEVDANVTGARELQLRVLIDQISSPVIGSAFVSAREPDTAPVLAETQTTFLADLEPVSDSQWESFWFGESGGELFEASRPTFGCVVCDEPRHVEYNLGGQFERFLATWAFDDESAEAEPSTLRVIVDGGTVAEYTIEEIGQTVPIDLDVRGAGRLRLELATPLSDSDIIPMVVDPRLAHPADE